MPKPAPRVWTRSPSFREEKNPAWSYGRKNLDLFLEVGAPAAFRNPHQKTGLRFTPRFGSLEDM